MLLFGLVRSRTRDASQLGYARSCYRCFIAFLPASLQSLPSCQSLQSCRSLPSCQSLHLANHSHLAHLANHRMVERVYRYCNSCESQRSPGEFPKPKGSCRHCLDKKLQKRREKAVANLNMGIVPPEKSRKVDDPTPRFYSIR